jgi:hypothetical protein
MVLVGAVYLALSWSHRGPIVYADEAGYLGNARWLAGGTLWWMGGAASYGLGYPLLIAPLFALGGSPEEIYRLVLVVNALLCMALAGLLYLVARKVLDVSPRAALACSAVGCAYPALTVQSGIAWVEVTAMVAVALFVLTAWWLFRSPGYATLLANAAVVVFLSTLHGRFTAMPILLIALLGYIARSRPDLRVPVLGTAGATVAVLVVAHFGQAAVHAARWNPGTTTEPVSLHRLISTIPAGLLASLAGQIWYLLVATAGLVLLGVAGIIYGFAGAPSHRAALSERETLSGTVMAAFVLLSCASVVLISVVSVSAGTDDTPTRIDYLFYGRYSDALVPVLLSLAVALLFVGVPRRRVTKILGIAAVMTVVFGTVTAVRVAGRFTGVVSNVTVPALLPLVADSNLHLRSHHIVWLVTLGAAAAIAMLAVLSWVRPRAIWVLLLCLFVPIGAVDASIMSPIVQETASRSLPIYSALRSLHPATVAYDLDDYSVWDFYGLPFWLDKSQFVGFHAASSSWPEAQLFVGPSVWPQAAARGLRLFRVDPASQMGLWIYR